MPKPFVKPEFERSGRDTSGSVREQQRRAARRLVEALELAEALPYTPKSELDKPVNRWWPPSETRS